MTDMTDQQRSALLMKAMGWILGEPHRHGMWTHVSVYGPSGTAVDSQIHPVIAFTDGKVLLDLYDPANMSLAFRVLNWASDSRNLRRSQREELELFLSGREDGVPKWWHEDAQRLWLDKIFFMAIEAGIVEVNE